VGKGLEGGGEGGRRGDLKSEKGACFPNFNYKYKKKKGKKKKKKSSPIGIACGMPVLWSTWRLRGLQSAHVVLYWCLEAFKGLLTWILTDL
jgi:hypothetical protein